MTHFLINRDADLYPNPMQFNPLRFFDMRKAPGQEEQHQFASLSSQNPA